jgi:hypothetical protein
MGVPAKHAGALRSGPLTHAVGKCCADSEKIDLNAVNCLLFAKPRWQAAGEADGEQASGLAAFEKIRSTRV